MNKRGSAIILLSGFLFVYCVVMIGFSIYDYSSASKICEPAGGDISVEHTLISRSSYYCIINNNKYEMARIVGDGFKIISDVNVGSHKQ